MRNVYEFKWGVLVGVAMVAGLLGAGCNISLPPQTRTVNGFSGSVDPENPLITDQVVGEEWDDVYLELDEICGLPDVSELVKLIEEEAGSFVANRITIDAITLDKMTFMARAEGDFSMLTQVIMELEFSGEETRTIRLDSGEDPSGFGTKMVLTPPDCVDVLGILRSPDNDCVSGRLGLSGTVPEDEGTIEYASKFQFTIYATGHLL